MKNLPSTDNVTHHKVPPSMVLKDSLRELRLNAKRSAQTLAAEVEGAAAQFPGPLGKPLGAVARAATHALKFADRTMVDLLTTDNHFRRGEFRLQQPSDFTGSDSDRQTRDAFTTQYYWECKTLLEIKDQPDFFIREQSICDAYFDFHDRIASVDQEKNYYEANPSYPSRPSLIAAHAILALFNRKPVACIHVIKATDFELIEKSAALNVQLCAAVVLASEIADLMHNVDSKTKAMASISLADEIVSARMGIWDTSVHGRLAHYNVAREMDFVLRHL